MDHVIKINVKWSFWDLGIHASDARDLNFVYLGTSLNLSLSSFVNEINIQSLSWQDRLS